MKLQSPSEAKELLEDRALTTEEVVAMSGVETLTLRNWINREILSIGMKHRLGRWAFSPADAMRVCAMVDLSRMGVTPSTAAKLAEAPVGLILKYIDAWAQAPESEPILSAQLSDYVVCALIDGDQIKPVVAFWDEGKLVPVNPDFSEHEAPHPVFKVSHLVLAAGLIAESVMTEAMEIMEASA